MPEFIPRPQLPTGLAQQLIEMLQVNPWAGAIESLGKSIGGAIDARGAATTRASDRQAGFGELQAKLAMGGNLAPMLQAQLGLPSPQDVARGVQGPMQGPEPAQGLTLADLAKMWGVPAPSTNQRVVQREKAVDPLDAQIKQADLAIKQERLKPKDVDPLDTKIKEADLAIKKFKLQSEKARANRKPVDDNNKSYLVSVWGKLRQERDAIEKNVGLDVDPERTAILNEKIRNIEEQLIESGIPLGSEMEGDLRRGREAVSSGRWTEEKFNNAMAEKYPSMAAKSGKSELNPLVRAVLDAIPGMAVISRMGR